MVNFSVSLNMLIYAVCLQTTYDFFFLNMQVVILFIVVVMVGNLGLILDEEGAKKAVSRSQNSRTKHDECDYTKAKSTVFQE